VPASMRNAAGMTPADRFDELVGELVHLEDVSPPAGGRRFGTQALRRRGRIFAMLSHGCLVVKLPRGRVDQLVAAGLGVRFDAGKGTPMKEWFVLAETADLPWTDLAHEALDFAAATARDRS
jgi:hypothetical protein